MRNKFEVGFSYILDFRPAWAVLKKKKKRLERRGQDRERKGKERKEKERRGKRRKGREEI